MKGNNGMRRARPVMRPMQVPKPTMKPAAKAPTSRMGAAMRGSANRLAAAMPKPRAPMPRPTSAKPPTRQVAPAVRPSAKARFQNQSAYGQRLQKGGPGTRIK